MPIELYPKEVASRTRTDYQRLAGNRKHMRDFGLIAIFCGAILYLPPTGRFRWLAKRNIAILSGLAGAGYGQFCKVKYQEFADRVPKRKLIDVRTEEEKRLIELLKEDNPSLDNVDHRELARVAILQGPAAFRKIAPKLRDLPELDLSPLGVAVNDDMLKMLKDHHPELRVFKLDDASISAGTLLDILPKSIRELDLRNCSRLGRYFCQNLGIMFPEIKKLTIPGCEEARDLNLSNFPDLHYLDTRDCRNLKVRIPEHNKIKALLLSDEQKEPLHLLNKCKAVTTLDIEDWKWGDATIAALPQFKQVTQLCTKSWPFEAGAFPNLESLHIDKVETEKLKAIVTTHKQLTSLIVDKKQAAEVLDAIGDLKLKHLDLTVRDVTNEQLTGLFKRIGGPLRSLRLYKKLEGTIDVCSLLVKHAKDLKSVTLDGFGEAPRASIKALYRKFPNLSVARLPEAAGLVPVVPQSAKLVKTYLPAALWKHLWTIRKFSMGMMTVASQPDRQIAFANDLNQGAVFNGEDLFLSLSSRLLPSTLTILKHAPCVSNLSVQLKKGMTDDELTSFSQALGNIRTLYLSEGFDDRGALTGHCLSHILEHASWVDTLHLGGDHQFTQQELVKAIGNRAKTLYFLFLEKPIKGVEALRQRWPWMDITVL